MRLIFISVLALLASAFGYGYIPYLFNKLNPSIYRKIENGLYTFKPGVLIKHSWLAKPGDIVRIDPDGFRTCPASNSEHGPLIAIIGDSFVYGLNLSEKDTLCALLGNELKRRNFGEFRIKNLGIPGLNLTSYAKMARMYSNKYNPDWIILGYLSYGQGGDDTNRFDAFYLMDKAENSFFFKLMTVLFGIRTTSKAYQLYDRLTVEVPPGEKTMTRLEPDISLLESLSGKSNLAILSYYGPDEFTDVLKKRIKNLEVIDLSLPAGISNGYFMPNDGHPTGKANREYAKRIADFIIERSRQSAKQQITR